MKPIIILMRTGSGLNSREHWRARSKRVYNERYAVGMALLRLAPPKPPLVVTLTRSAPSNGLDDDNLCGSLKSVRDQIAQWIDVDDKRRDIVRYEYRQCRGPWGVGIQWAPMVDQAPLAAGRAPT